MTARCDAERPECRWTTVASRRVHARLWVRAVPVDSPCIVLVHGIGVASRDFLELGALLAPRARVYAVDLPGFGESGKPPRPLNIVHQADALAAWMDATGLERATLLGNSVGCQVVAHVAVRRPELADRLILIGPTFDPRARTFARAIARFARNGRYEPLRLLPIQIRDCYAAGPNRLIASFRLAMRDRIEEQLAQIGAPVLIVRGELDRLVPQEWAEDLVRVAPDGRLAVVPAAAHAVSFSLPEALARIVLPFLSDERPGVPTGVPRAVPVAGFDSASAMLRATAHALKGQDFPLVGAVSGRWQPALEPVGRAISRLPASVREQIYIWSGAAEATPPEQLRSVRAEQLAQFAVGQYPRRRYPAVALGSSNGALVHLWTALGVPWLPQTVLIPVRRDGVPPDEPRRDLEWGRGPARWLLDANPGLQLHHMHDPNQDRLMVQRMTYFRVKHRELPQTYVRFLEETLEPGGTLFLVECGLRWPTIRAGERHVFQFGALGGATPDEYLHGGPRVDAYLRRHNSPRRYWDPPEPDDDHPEAEWGFDPALRPHVEALARRHGWRLRRIMFEQPEDPSPLVADLYRRWFRRLGRPDGRLLVESFVLMDPHRTLHQGLVPFWTVFNVEPSAAALERYLDQADPPYDEIDLMLFSHGVDSIGLASIKRWRSLLRRARRGRFVGVDQHAYPQDFGTVARYNPALRRLPGPRFTMPPPLTLTDLDVFLDESGDAYAVRWLDDRGP